MKASLAKGMPHGYEVGYDSFTINGRQLHHGEPVKVKQGQRVLFHILNGSATEIRSLALPAHTFEVVSMDGNPVPTPSLRADQSCWPADLGNHEGCCHGRRLWPRTHPKNQFENLLDTHDRARRFADDAVRMRMQPGHWVLESVSSRASTCDISMTAAPPR